MKATTTVSVHGAKLAVRVDGPAVAPALLLSNSLSSELSMWDDQLPRWSRRWRVIRYDTRGHGDSVAEPGPYSIAHLAEDALCVLDHVGIAKAHFCGLSMGGMVGMWLLRHAGERIDRAVLANTSAHIGPRELWDNRIALARTGGIEATVEPTVQRWFPPAFHGFAPATIDRVRAMIRRTSMEGYAGCCAAIREMDQRASLGMVRNPTLVIIGTVDPATTPTAGRLIEQSIPGAIAVELEAAHISNIQQPEAFGAVVEVFLTAI
jgi:3-oxoadipate enol-lactonase